MARNRTKQRSVPRAPVQCLSAPERRHVLPQRPTPRPPSRPRTPQVDPGRRPPVAQDRLRRRGRAQRRPPVHLPHLRLLFARVQPQDPREPQRARQGLRDARLRAPRPRLSVPRLPPALPGQGRRRPRRDAPGPRAPVPLRHGPPAQARRPPRRHLRLRRRRRRGSSEGWRDPGGRGPRPVQRRLAGGGCAGGGGRSVPRRVPPAARGRRRHRRVTSAAIEQPRPPPNE
mmetsp:Transcript_66848/g.178714  ORF Transcript_66848/g.178714 Transcript_66848/m.178714 type:complete len:229 (-) Transcript_66848:65-751(-)